MLSRLACDSKLQSLLYIPGSLADLLYIYSTALLDKCQYPLQQSLSVVCKGFPVISRESSHACNTPTDKHDLLGHTGTVAPCYTESA